MRWLVTFMMITISLFSNAQTQVHIISSLHKFHNQSKAYSYDTLYQRIESIHPDFIGVEIRSFDMNEDEEYLSKYYPLEMRMIMNKFKSTTIIGFDWLGDEVMNNQLSEAYFMQMPAKVQ